RRAVALDPDNAAAHHNLGNALKAVERLEDAVAHYRRAVALKPDFAAAQRNLGALLRQLDRPGEAVVALRAAIGVDPNDAKTVGRLGRTLADLGLFDEALAACDRAVGLQPGDARLHLARANVLRKADRDDEAIAGLRQTLAVDPAMEEAHYNLGTALYESGRFADAAVYFRRAVELKSDYADAHCNLALSLLLDGRLEEGWRESEWRWRGEDFEKKRPFPQPIWSGEPLAGKAILVTAEQGAGDEVLFAGMVPDLTAAGARVTLECDRRLKPLFERSLPGVACVPKEVPPAAATQSPVFDYQVTAGDLGRWLRPDLESFPGRPSYLVADAKRRDALRAGDRERGGGPVVGVAWISKNKRLGRHKSMKLAELAPLTAVPGVTLVDLQYGDTAAERQAFEQATGTTVIHDDAVDQMASLDDFAAQVAATDLVITVSNTTAHMAGALGVPGWVLLHSVPLACWLLGRDDSPWYPSLRLYRQARRGEWAAVIDRVAAALGAMLRAARR
ncbi:MAG: tetratricopeptide repeat protein, partial [Rhodospirillales bacterium]